MKPSLPLALFLLLLPVAARAQDAPAAPKAAPHAIAPQIPAPDAPRPAGYVEFSAGQSVFDDSKGIGVYTGDVTATQQGEDFILYAQYAKSFRKVNQAIANKDLRIETRESTIRGQQLFADFNTKVFSITGSVVVSSYGEKDGVQTAGAAKRRAAQNRQPVRIACDRLDWNYDTRQATLVGNIRIVQGDSVGTCNQIIYDEPKNAARLLGDVRFGNTQRQQFFSDDLLLFIDSGQIENKTGVRVVGPVNNDSDAKTAAPVVPKTVEAFPEPAPLTDTDLPKPPPDIEKYLPKKAAPKVATAPPDKTPAAKTPPAQTPAPAATPDTDVAPTK